MVSPISPHKGPIDGSPLKARLVSQPNPSLIRRVLLSSHDEPPSPPFFSGIAKLCEEAVPFHLKSQFIDKIKTILDNDVELGLLLYYLDRDGPSAPLYCDSYLEYRFEEMLREISSTQDKFHEIADKDFKLTVPSPTHHYIYSALVRMIYTPAGRFNPCGGQAVKALLQRGIGGHLGLEYCDSFLAFTDHLKQKSDLFEKLIDQLGSTQIEPSMADFVRLEWKELPDSDLVRTRLVWSVLMTLALPCGQKIKHPVCFAVAATAVALDNSPENVLIFLTDVLNKGHSLTFPIAPQASKHLENIALLDTPIDPEKMSKIDVLAYIFQITGKMLPPPKFRLTPFSAPLEESFDGKMLEWTKRLVSSFNYSPLMQVLISSVTCDHLNSPSADSQKNIILTHIAEAIGLTFDSLVPYFFLEILPPNTSRLVFYKIGELKEIGSIHTLKECLTELFPEQIREISSLAFIDKMQQIVETLFKDENDPPPINKEGFVFRDPGGWADKCLRDCFSIYTNPITLKGSAQDLFLKLNDQITDKSENSFLLNYPGHVCVLKKNLNSLFGQPKQKIEEEIENLMITPSQTNCRCPLKLTQKDLSDLLDDFQICLTKANQIIPPSKPMFAYQIAAYLQNELRKKGFFRVSTFDLYKQICIKSKQPMSIPFADLNWMNGSDATMPSHDLLALSYDQGRFYFEILNPEFPPKPFEDHIKSLTLYKA